MKTAAEIRAHRDAVRICMEAPCGCRGTRHEDDCHQGLMMMKAVVETLSWALGENPTMQRHVEEMRQRALIQTVLNKSREN